MRPYSCLLLIAIAACAPAGVDGQDMAAGAIRTLSLVAGGLGGSGSADGIGAAAGFSSPSGVAADGAGNLYVADTTNDTIRKVVLATGVVSTLAGAVGMPGSADGTGAAARFAGPVGMAADSAGNLYVADSGNHTIRKIVLATGAVSTLAGAAGMSGSTDGTGTAARFYNPSGVAADSAGNLYVADTTNYTIRKVVLATGVVSTLAGAARMPGSADGTGIVARFDIPYGVAADSAGNLYVANPSAIRKIVLATGVVSTLAGAARMPGSTDGTGTTARFSIPYGVAADEAGNLYVADHFNSTIRRVSLPDSSVTTFAGVVGQTGIKLGLLPASSHPKRPSNRTGMTAA